MYEPEELITEPETDERAARVVTWLDAQRDVERTLSEPLGGLPSLRDESISRMADVLQGMALGLGMSAAAMWAGVPDRVLQSWLKKDSAFAAAAKSASDLAAAHGLQTRGKVTPAKLRVALIAISRGETWSAAAVLAGFSTRQYRKLWGSSPMMVALVNAARRARRLRTSSPQPNTSAPDHKGYRLVQYDAPGSEGD
ncbi:hypothetical protein ACIRU3_21170 [Streptomyces sp. NPDC101151]|uniref:hypothetical protein n=1 Tax=Streptomyces sp. NPDC101151 TaxID=3366115 RepID=UPI00382EC573